MKKLIFASLFAVSALFVACSDSDEAQVLLNNVDVTFTITPQGDFNEVFDLQASAAGDTNKAQNVFTNWSGDNLVVDLEYLSCPANISLKLQRTPKSSFVIDESKEYDLSYSIKTTVHKYYNDGSSKVDNMPALPQGGKVKGAKMAAYLETVKGKTEQPISLSFDANGDTH